MILVLFGATGDLARRMVLPALYELHRLELLPEAWTVIGSGRGDQSNDEFISNVRDSLSDSEDFDITAFSTFAEHVRFAGGGFSVDDPGELLDVIAEVRDISGSSCRGGEDLIHFIALPPSVFVGYTKAFAAHGLADGAKAVYEKPFGDSPEHFDELNDVASDVFEEDQIYVVDHFLAKEATQNIREARFGNQLFAELWDKRHIERVVIDVPETLGVDDRAEFYDSTGAFLDMVATHLFRLAVEVAVEPPESQDEAGLRAAREQALAAFGEFEPDDAVFGQFDGYRDLEGVEEGSKTETFAAVRLWADTERWSGVPFVLRTGKRLDTDSQLVTLVFRDLEGKQARGELRFNLAGSGAVELALNVKRPGPGYETTTAALRLDIDEAGKALSPYARLILDVVAGDHTLFTRPSEMALVWQKVKKLLGAQLPMHSYAPGSRGPEAADELLR